MILELSHDPLSEICVSLSFTSDLFNSVSVTTSAPILAMHPEWLGL